MMKRGADVNMQNKYGETALHTTAKRGNVESSLFLLNNKADIDVLDTFGETGIYKYSFY